MTRLVAMLIVFTLAACTSEPPPPPGGTLRVEVLDLPDGAVGKVHVTGPRTDTRIESTRDLTDVQPGKYVVEAEPVRHADLTSYPVVPRVEVDVLSGQQATAVAQYGNEVLDTTKVLDGSLVVSGADQRVVVLSPNAPPVSPGQILVAGVGPSTPQGLLRKVVSVSGSSVTTEPATLYDAVPAGEITLRHQVFGDAKIQGFRGGLPGQVDVSFPTGGGTCDNGSLSGTMGMAWHPWVDYDFKWRKKLGVPVGVKRAKFYVGMDREVGGDFTRGVSAKCSLEIKVPRLMPYLLGTFVVPIGPIPVVVTVNAQFIGSVELSAGAETEYKFDGDEKLEIGGEYTDGELKGKFELPLPEKDPKTTGSVELSAKVGIRFGVSVFGITGPYVDLTTGFRTGVTPPAFCTGVYGDIGWQFASDVSFTVPDVVKVERQRLPKYDPKCPLGADPKPKLKQSKRPVTPEDYRWLVGNWERKIMSTSEPDRTLELEKLTVTPEGHVTYIRQSFIEVAYGKPIQCEGVFEIRDNGNMFINYKSGPAEYMGSCHNTFSNSDARYAPSEPPRLPERLIWFTPAERGFTRV